MNDELSGQLTSSWLIPQYARGALWLETESCTVQTEGDYGQFILNAPASQLTVRWGGDHGPALARLSWQVDTLDWDGRVRVGGYVDAIHVTELPGITYPITVIYMGGQPLKQGAIGFPDTSIRAAVPYPTPEFYAPLAAEVKQAITTWLVPDESPLATVAQRALMDNLRLHFFGRLSDDESGWGSYFALPILLQAVTLFGP